MVMRRKAIMKADGTIGAADELDLMEPWDEERTVSVALRPEALSIERASLLRTFDFVRERALMNGMRVGRKGLGRRKWAKELSGLLSELAVSGGRGLILRAPVEAAFDVALARWAWSQAYHEGLRYETCLPDPQILDEQGWRYGTAETPARLYGARRARLDSVPEVEGSGTDPARHARQLLEDGLYVSEEGA